jgi:uncharacterized protein (DUF1330 family)
VADTDWETDGDSRVSAANPAFLFIEVAGEHADQVGLWRTVSDAVRQEKGVVFASGAAGRIAILEPGGTSAGMLVARWSDASALKVAARDVLLPLIRAAIPSASVPLALCVNGLPVDGLPEMLDIPTVASVPKPPREPRNSFLVVRGTAWDQERLNAYRDVILPMHKERGGYYEAFAIQPGEVTALSGEWTEQIFAISRWPSRSAAEDFWYCDRYQRQAIPLRLGAGRFTVHMLDAD